MENEMEYQSEIYRLNRELDELLELCTFLMNLLGYNMRAKSRAQWALGSMTTRVSDILDESRSSVASR